MTVCLVGSAEIVRPASPAGQSQAPACAQDMASAWGLVVAVKRVGLVSYVTSSGVQKVVGLRVVAVNARRMGFVIVAADSTDLHVVCTTQQHVLSTAKRRVFRTRHVDLPPAAMELRDMTLMSTQSSIRPRKHVLRNAPRGAS